MRRSASDGLPEAPAAPASPDREYRCRSSGLTAYELLKISLSESHDIFQYKPNGAAWRLRSLMAAERFSNHYCTDLARAAKQFYGFSRFNISIHPSKLHLLRFLFCSRNRGGLNNRHTIPITRFNPESLCLTPDLPSPSRRFSSLIDLSCAGDARPLRPNVRVPQGQTHPDPRPGRRAVSLGALHPAAALSGNISISPNSSPNMLLIAKCSRRPERGYSRYVRSCLDGTGADGNPPTGRS